MRMKPALAWNFGYFTYLLFNNWDRTIADLEVPSGDIKIHVLKTRKCGWFPFKNNKVLSRIFKVEDMAANRQAFQPKIYGIFYSVFLSKLKTDVILKSE